MVNKRNQQCYKHRKFTNIQSCKVNKKHKILFFCTIFVANCVFSQSITPYSKAALLFKNFVNPIATKVPAKNTASVTGIATPFLSANYYATQLGFFCKQEIKMEKSVKIPFKFRLGSVEDCDRMEGKRKADYSLQGLK